MYRCYLFDDHDSVMDIWPFQCENDREAEESALDLQAALSASAAEVWRGGRLVFRSSPGANNSQPRSSTNEPTTNGSSAKTGTA